MLIGDYFKNLNPKYKSHYFSGLSFNSLNCKKNNIFFAIQGNNNDGNKFIKDAIENGAKTIVSNLKYQGYKNKILYEINKEYLSVINYYIHIVKA